MPDPVQTKRALARLASGPPDDASAVGTPVADAAVVDTTIVDTARRARTDLDGAAEFVASGGVECLRRVADRTGEGRDVLESFERFREACQFHPAHVTDIPAGPKDTPD